MGSSYSEVPERLCEYRKALSLNQEEMGRRFGVGQDHYSKLENGGNVISYKSLKKFEENGGDIYFLITGKERQTGVVDEYIDQCSIEKIAILKMILWITEQCIKNDAAGTFEVDLAWKYISLLEEAKESSSIWRNIRKVENLSQIQMAARLDINIKRYQRLESMQVYPDAEILHTVFHEFGYSPLVIMGGELVSLEGINRIWNGFSENMRNSMLYLLDQIVKLIQQLKEKQD